MVKKISKTQAKEEIQKFFLDIKNKDPKDIKKIKKLAMSQNIPLKENRKLFCKKCLESYSNKEKIRIKNKTKIITCKNCDSISRIKL
jgi:RNase P subunit RPR2